MSTKRAMGLLTLAMIVAMFMGASGAQAIPTKFLFSGQIGWKVDKTTGGNVCTVASKDECRESAEENGEPGGFSFPESVAVAPSGNVYVADKANHRIQELTKTGEFVLMFGWDVNKTKVEQVGATQREKNLCTAASGDVCQAGEKGTGLPGQLFGGQDVAIDPLTGNVYVLNVQYERVDEFTETGEFVLMVGGDVNETTGGNLCTEEEVENTGVKCKAGVAGTGVDAFNPRSTSAGNLLAVGGPEDLLYVGDEGRVQEFRSNGTPVPGISLAALSAARKVQSLAVDPAGDVFVVDDELEAAVHEEEVPELPGVYRYNAKGELQPEVVDPQSSAITAVAIDAYGRLGVVEPARTVKYVEIPALGAIYTTAGVKVAEFASPSAAVNIGLAGLAFAIGEAKPSDRLYMAASDLQKIETYAPVVFPQVIGCPAEMVAATSARLCGSVDPEGLQAKAYFEYGVSASLGSRTAVAFEGLGEAFEGVGSEVTGLVPNQAYDYETVAEAEVEEKEAQTVSPLVGFHTPTPAPELVGAPSASFIGSRSVVFGATLNPEHAPTRYRFEYAACESESQSLDECGSPQSVEGEASAQYGASGVAREVRGLLPQTPYAYRLIADNEHEEGGKAQGGQSTGAEGHFTTGPAVSPSALTGGFAGVSTTSALVAGAVDPDGQSATYAFETGVYEGAATQWGVVFSGPAGAGTTPVEESLALTGLQPGTTYAYRISVSSGYIVSESHTVYGALATFTTAGLPSVLALPSTLGMLAVPSIKFPKEPAKVTPKKLTKAQQLARALRACKKKARKQRASCERGARKQFGAKRPKLKKK